MRFRWSPVVLLGCLALAACTDTNVYVELDPDEPVLRVQVDAEICAPDSIVEDVPYKILFVIDTSLSNKWNDADQHRVQAFVDAVESHIGKNSVYFGIVTFNDYSHRPTLVFTDNRDILLAAANTLNNEHAGGGTNYEDAIQEMHQFIVDDLNSLASPLEALRTRYWVYWLSDGIPTFGTTDRPTLVANVEAVAQYLRPKVSEFVLNTLYLESTGEWETEEEIAGARQLLREMAEAGGGNFTNISSGEEFSFDIQPIPQIRSFQFITAVASNRNVYFGSRQPRPDSDGDGLIDTTEASLGLAPSLPDTDGDFYRDGVEYKIAWLNPAHPDAGCVTDDLDSDGDGLWDCEEIAIGTNPYKPDTDGDYLLDSMEFKLDGSPLSDDTSADTDLDGLPDHAEVIAHLAPHAATVESDRTLWAYRYELDESWTSEEDGRNCHRVRVDNVAVYQTLETAEHPTGWQTIELVVVFETNDGLGLVEFYKAEGRAGFLLPHEVHPPTGIVEIGTEDFEPLSASCVSGGPGCHLPPQENCGNGLLDPGEECDAGDFGDLTCASFGYGDGDLACLPTCQLDVTGCEGAPDSCGNGVRDSGEECDGSDLGGASCGSLKLGIGGLGCSPDCHFDTSGCLSAPDTCQDGTYACNASGGIQGTFSGCHTGPDAPAGTALPSFLLLLAGLAFRNRLSARA